MIRADVGGLFAGMALIGGDVAELLVEVLCIAALLAVARRVAPAAIAAPKRPSWRALLLLTVLVIVPIASATALVSPRVQQRIFDVAAGKRAATVNTAILEDDAMRVAVCGSSAPLPSKARAKACIAVFAGGRFYVVDVGPESVENLMTWGIPLSEIGGVLLTHFHSDHVGDLGELNLQTWAAGRRMTLPVYGGPGVDRVVDGFNEARVKLLVFYHLLPAPDAPLARSVFGNGITEARGGDWTIADDGSLYTLPLGNAEVRIGTVVQ